MSNMWFTAWKRRAVFGSLASIPVIRASRSPLAARSQISAARSIWSFVSSLERVSISDWRSWIIVRMFRVGYEWRG